MASDAGVLPSACHADLATEQLGTVSADRPHTDGPQSGASHCARFDRVCVGSHINLPLPDLQQQQEFRGFRGQQMHHFERALRFQMAGRVFVQGPSVACLYRPYRSSFACAA